MNAKYRKILITHSYIVTVKALLFCIPLDNLRLCMCAQDNLIEV